MRKYDHILTILPKDFETKVGSSRFNRHLIRPLGYPERDIIIKKVLQREYPGAQIKVPTTHVNGHWEIGAPFNLRIVMLAHPRELSRLKFEFLQGAKKGYINIIEIKSLT